VKGTAASPPAEVTLATCIGCGALTLPGRCPEGCAQERKLELVPAAELSELTALTEAAEGHADALRAAVIAVARYEPGHDGDMPDPARARAALATDGHVDPRLRDLVSRPIEPVVSWWCPRCGGVDAPQPCLGVCIRTPVAWANAQHARETQARAAALLDRNDELRAVLILVAHTHPRPGEGARHWDVVRRRATLALAAS
jgi:hypothetical protein